MVLHWIKYTYNKLGSAQIHSEIAGGRASWGRMCRLTLMTTAYKWFGGNRNLEESSGFLRIPPEYGVNTGIPVTQKFLQKILLKQKKQEFLWPLPKPHSCEKTPPENAGKDRNPQESWQECFFHPKNKFLKTEITNLASRSSLCVDYLCVADCQVPQAAGINEAKRITPRVSPSPTTKIARDLWSWEDFLTRKKKGFCPLGSGT